MSRTPDVGTNRSIIIHVRVTPDERATIEALKNDNESVSQFLRRLIVKERTCQQQDRSTPSPQASPYVAPSVTFVSPHPTAIRWDPTD